MKLNLIGIRLATASFCFLPAILHAQADSVTGGRTFTGKSKIVILTNPVTPKPEPPGLTYLLSGVLMQSSVSPSSTSTVKYGPFINSSPYVVTATFIHTGGSSHHHVNAYVDGATVGHTEGDMLTFQIPQGSTYSWELKNDHTITASVPANTRSSFDSGLPAATAFQSPRRTGKYLGCLFTPNGALNYVYTVSPMTDGSNAWGGPVPSPDFGTVVIGPPPYWPPPPTEECVLVLPSTDPPL